MTINKIITPCVRCLNRTAEERSGFFPDLFILMEEDEPSENILLLSPISAFFLLLSHSLQSKTHRESTHHRLVKSEKQKAGHSERWTHRFECIYGRADAEFPDGSAGRAGSGHSEHYWRGLSLQKLLVLPVSPNVITRGRTALL